MSTLTNLNLTTPSANITNSTASTSVSTGALIVTGGVGIGGRITTNNLIVITPDYGSLKCNVKTIPTSSDTNFFTGATNPVAVSSGNITADSVNGDIDITQTGVYNISASCAFTYNATGIRYGTVLVSNSNLGTSFKSQVYLPIATNITQVNMTLSLYITGPASISFTVFQDTGGDLTTASFSYLTVSKSVG